MKKKRVFIGSSTEALHFAEKAESILEKEYDVTIWNDGVWDSSVFKINNNFLYDLLKASLKFDYGILIGTCDDEVVYRKTKVLQPRDNILFELGLFIGRLGISKCAFVIEEELKLLTDLQGISLSKFSKTDSKSFSKAILEVQGLFSSTTIPEINFFPSSTLAAVYFENLVKPICKYLISNNGFEFDKKKYNDCGLYIVLPQRIDTDVNLQFQKIKSRINTKNVSFEYDGRPRSISIDTKISEEKLKFIDFPTVITGINFSLSNLLPQEFSQLNSDYELVLSRELERFKKTLKHLLLRDGFDDIVQVIDEDDL